MIEVLGFYGVAKKVTAFWVVKQYNLVQRYQHSRKIYLPKGWRQQGSPKRWYQGTKLYGFTSQKTIFFIVRIILMTLVWSVDF